MEVKRFVHLVKILPPYLVLKRLHEILMAHTNNHWLITRTIYRHGIIHLAEDKAGTNVILAYAKHHKYIELEALI